MSDLGLDARLDRMTRSVRVKPKAESKRATAYPDDTWAKADIQDWLELNEIEFDRRWGKNRLIELYQEEAG